MNTTHHGSPSWKAELSQAASRLLSEIDDACVKLASGVARGLKIGLPKLAEMLAEIFTPPRPPDAADFADWCLVDIVDRQGRVRDVAVAHRVKDKEGLASVHPRGRGGPRRLRRSLPSPTAGPSRVPLAALSWHAGGTPCRGSRKLSFFSSNLSGVDGTRTRGLRRDRPAL